MQGVGKTAPRRRTRLTAAQRRESILEAATEVFAAAGYRAGKVSDIAARVRVTEPVIFQNFGTKAALYAAVLDRMAGQTQAELQALTDHHGSAPELLAHVLSPPPGSQPHGPGAHHQLFADAATLAARGPRGCRSPRRPGAARPGQGRHPRRRRPRGGRMAAAVGPVRPPPPRRRHARSSSPRGRRGRPRAPGPHPAHPGTPAHRSWPSRPGSLSIAGRGRLDVPRPNEVASLPMS